MGPASETRHRFRRRSPAAGELAVRPLPGRLPDSRDEPRTEEKTPAADMWLCCYVLCLVGNCTEDSSHIPGIDELLA